MILTNTRKIQTPAHSKRAGFLFLTTLILFYLINGSLYLQSQSLTADEGSFFNYAARFLKGQPERIYPVSDNSKMPISILNTIPRIVKQYILGLPPTNDYGISDIMHGRYITLFLSVASILLVFIWSKQLFGMAGGLFSAFLFSICPNHLSNAALVTTDAYSVFFLLATLYTFWKFIQTKSNTYFILFSVLIATSQLVKQSLLHVYILIAIYLLYILLFKNSKVRLIIIFKRISVFCIINWLVINLGFYFTDSFLPLNEYKFISSFFKNIQETLPARFIIPFPKPFVEGLDMAKYYDQIGGGLPHSSFGNVTILGKSFTGHGIWYYYFVSLFFKTPITYLILILISLFQIFKKNTNIILKQHALYLLSPVVYFLIVFSFLYNTQCGIRHIIFIFPFLFILMGVIASVWKNRLVKFAILSLCIFLLCSVFSYWRNYYPYTNEFVLNKTNAIFIIGASNLDFQQGYFFAENYLKQNPTVKRAGSSSNSGRFLIGIQDYADIWNEHKFDWINKYKPIGHVGHSYLIVDVPMK